MRRSRTILVERILTIWMNRGDKRYILVLISNFMQRKIGDKERYEIVSQEIKRFNKLIEGHRKLLEAIGNL